MPQAKDNPNAQLVPVESDTSLPAIALPADGPLTVGRSDETDVTIPDSSLSRRHATIWHQDGNWWIRDEGSLNGTWVNGERIEGTQLLDGDGVDFGGNAAYHFTVDAPRKADPGGDREGYRSRVFCLALESEGGDGRLVLRRRLSIVGRNETADLRLDEPSVSGVHAKIEYAGGRVVLHDSGSKNGTVVNGEPVRRLNLVPGDRVAFGGAHFAVRRTWLPSAAALSGTVAAALVLVAIALVPVFLQTSSSQAEPLWTRDMYLAQVTESLRLAIEACDAEPRRTEVAVAQFAIAKRSLIGADEMRPDRQTDEDLARALREAAGRDRLRRMLDGRDVYELYRSLSEPPDEPDADPDSRPMPDEPLDLDRELSRMVAQFGIDTRQRPIPPRMRDEVERYIEFWTVEKRGFTERAYRRGRPHLEMIRTELRAAQLPEVFCYLPFIESGYQADITSSAKARGLWQFMPSTGRAHGLRVDDEVDERTDPQKATKAACSYINSLLNMFGPNAFLCAVAAYNKGENGMARCLKKNADWRSTWKFWDVASAGDGCLKQETIEYVPRFLAAAVVLRRPEVFGLTTD